MRWRRCVSVVLHATVVSGLAGSPAHAQEAVPATQLAPAPSPPPDDAPAAAPAVPAPPPAAPPPAAPPPAAPPPAAPPPAAPPPPDRRDVSPSADPARPVAVAKAGATAVDPHDLPADDPRVPSFLRALRLGEDSLILGGYVQPGFTYVVDTPFNEEDTDGFEFNNIRLVGRGDAPIRGKLGFGFRFNFDVNRGNFSVRDAYGTLHWDHDLVAFDVGQQKTPFGLAQLQPESGLQFPQAAITNRLSFDRDLGVRLRTDFPIGPVWIHLAGFFGNADFGFRQRRNIDDEFVWVGRLEVAPLGRMRFSEPELDDSSFKLVAGFAAGYSAAQGDALGIADVGAEDSRVEGDLRLGFHGASLRGEYVQVFRGDNGLAEAFQRYAVAVQAGYVLPIPISIPRFELVARWQQIDVNLDATGEEGTDYVIDNTEVRNVSFGLNTYVADHAVKLQGLYTLTDLLEGPAVDEGGNPLIGDRVEIFAQFGWL